MLFSIPIGKNTYTKVKHILDKSDQTLTDNFCVSSSRYNFGITGIRSFHPPWKKKLMWTKNADKPLSMVLPSDGDIIKSQNKVSHVSATTRQ